MHYPFLVHILCLRGIECLRGDRMKRIWLFVFCLLLLCACTVERPADPAALVAAMAETGGETSGKLYIYDMRSDTYGADNAQAMPESLIAAAYGEGEEDDLFAPLEAYAVYLSPFAEPIEYGCFVVSRERDVGTIVEICLRRMDAIARLCGDSCTSSPPLVMGQCVFYAVGENADAALDRAREIMSGGGNG